MSNAFKVIIPEKQFDCIVIPSFTIAEGEIVVIRLPSGPIFQTVVQDFQAYFTSLSQFSFIRLAPYRRLFFLTPVTVEGYIRKYGNPLSPIIKRMYRSATIKPDAAVSSLISGKQKLLALVTTLSVTKNVILDLSGVDVVTGFTIFNILKENAADGGSTVLLECGSEFKNECTLFIEGIVI